MTDLLMASMVGLESFGVSVDFPDEPTTGGDMDWVFAAPIEVGGGRYLRFILQAKRAQYQKLKHGGYWYYQHLDHGNPKGSQAKTLISHAGNSPGGMATLPLYILYHPSSALEAAVRGLPAVAGANLVFGRHVAAVVQNGCTRREKKLSFWRKRFLSLSDVLCWPAIVTGLRQEDRSATHFLVGLDEGFIPAVSGGFHPDLVAQRMRSLFQRTPAVSPPSDQFFIEPANDIPGDIRRAIDGTVTLEDRRALKRPRVVFSTQLTRAQPAFEQVERISRRRE